MLHRTLVTVALIATTMSACASTPGSSTTGSGTTPPSQDTKMQAIAAGQSTSMSQGQSVRLSDGGTLTYVTVAQDSRCPPNAKCIRAGDADIQFTFTPAGGSAMAVTPNLPEAPSKPIGSMRLTVEQLAFGDAPAVTVRVDPQ